MIIRIVLFFFLAMIFSPGVSGQGENYRMLGEGNKDVVKLIWFIKQWPAGLQGFTIKRRTVSGISKGGWTQVHPGVIVPGISRKKDFANTDKEAFQQRRLFKKLDSLLSAGKTKEIETEAYILKLRSDTTALKALALPFAIDYDLALINGFGYIDRSVPLFDGSYEYGLFPVFNGSAAAEPVDSYKWKHGSQPDLTIDLILSAVPARKQKQVEVKWKVSVAKFKAKELNGFNVYRRDDIGNYKKLNSAPVWIHPQKDTAEVSFYDITAVPDKKYSYAIAPLSLFGTEGKRINTGYDPALFNRTVSLPVLKIQSGSDTSRAIKLNWDFPKEQENLIKNFIVERTDLPSGQSSVIAILPSGTRTASDTRPKKLKNYYRYCIRIVRDNFPDSYSNEVLVYYEPEIKPPAPKNLQVSLVTEGEKKFALLTWDKKTAEDSLTSSYRIYANFPPSDKILYEAGIPDFASNSYRYELLNFEASKYLFRVSAVSPHKHESALSDTVTLNAPSAYLPNTNIWPFRADSNVVTLQWTYPPVPDLKGFRIFLNGQQTANENTLGKNSREWTSDKLVYGKTYTFELQAISATGVISKKSIPRVLLIEKK